MQCALFFLLLLNPDLDYIANTICLGFNLVHLKEWWKNSKKLFQFSKFFRKYFCNIQVKITQFWKMQIANKDQVKVKKKYYLHKWIICWCNEIFSLSRWHVQTGDGTMFSQNNISNFGSINDFKIRNLSVSGQSQDLTLTGMISSPNQSWCGCQNKPSLKFFKTRKEKSTWKFIYN